MTNLTMPNKISFMKYAPKTVPGVADVGVPHGGKDGLPELRLEGPDQKFYAYQREKLKGLNM